MGILSYSNGQKIETLGEPLYPVDLFIHYANMGELVRFTGAVGKPILYGMVAGACVLGWAGWKVLGNPGPANWIRRIAALAIVLVFHFLLVTDSAGFLSGIQKASGLVPEEYSWRQNENYRSNGVLGGFVTNLGNLRIRKPEGYSRELADSALGRNAEKPETGNARIGNPEIGTGTLPDVVVILSESFWDVTKLPSVRITPDPLENFRKIAPEGISGTMTSPMFGGKTAAVEFEVLTGNSMALLPKGSIPYQQYVFDGFPSLPRLFRENGYRTSAVHTFEKSFFNRAGAYPKLGFDRFVAKEDIPDPKYEGPFISDETFTDEILKRLDDGSDGKPSFLFGISMENHFSYEGHKFDAFDVDVSASGGNLDAEDLVTIRNYAQGIRAADRQLGRLVEILRKRERPTAVLFFGDHLGILRDEYGAYVRSGFLPSSDESSWSPEEALAMRSPDFLLWANYPLPQSVREAFPEGNGNPAARVRAAFLGDLAIRVSGIRPDPRYLFLREAALCVDAGTVDPKPKNAPGCPEAFHEYASVQYRTTFDRK